MTFAYEDYVRAADLVREKITAVPQIGLVLGSGLGSLADEIQDAVAIPYDEIPGWPRSTVHGHSGRLVVGNLAGKLIAAQQGRAHFYEGYTMAQVVFPVRVLRLLGVHTLILTNAAGGLDPGYAVGDLMLLNDHINLPGMAGQNPLVGPNEDRLGPRFVGMSQTYDRGLRSIARAVAERENIPLHEGVYVAVSGPQFETPAEVRMLRLMGAHAVGMSTVHEVLAARHLGMRVLACSGITNQSIDRVDTELDANHEEVLEAGKLIVPRLTRLLRGVIQEI